MVVVAYFAAVAVVVVVAWVVMDSRIEVAHNWFAVAIVAAQVVVATAFAIVDVDIADMNLVVVASCIPLLQHDTIHYRFSVSI